jgi:hypothetical protein
VFCADTAQKDNISKIKDSAFFMINLFSAMISVLGAFSKPNLQVVLFGPQNARNKVSNKQH